MWRVRWQLMAGRWRNVVTGYLVVTVALLWLLFMWVALTAAR